MLADGLYVSENDFFILSESGEKTYPESSETSGETFATRYPSGIVTTFLSGCGFRQIYEGERPVSGVGFSLRVSKRHFSIIVPAWNGVRLSADHPLFWTGWTDHVEYGQNDLQMQMLLIEGKNGGFVVMTRDEGTFYKSFYVADGGDSFILTVVSSPAAPFDSIMYFDTGEWSISKYTGDWTQGAEIYKRYVEGKRSEHGVSKPLWAGNIRLFFLTDLWCDREQIKVLSRFIDPHRVLLHVPGWRVEPYDINLPDYTPKPHTADYISFAQGMGYRVQLHFNMNGFQQEKPDFPSLARYQVRNAYSGESVYAEYTADGVHVKFAQMNPASAEWRAYITDKICEAVRKTGCDSAHLDESLFARNDRAGLTDGLTPIQGNVVYHRELKEKLGSDIALGGEGITDFNAIYGTFMQSHVYGVDPPRPFNPAMQSQIVPLTAFVFDDNIVPYHWPGYPASKNESEFLEWHIAGETSGLTATIMRDGASEISDPSNLAIRAVISEANYLGDNGAKRRFEGLGGDILMRYSLENGRIAAFVKNGSKYVFLKDEEDTDSALYEIEAGNDGLLHMKGLGQ